MPLTNTKQNQIQRTWHLVDVADKVIGREATVIANLLRGKNKSYFVSHMDCGDFVVVINAKQVKATGRKEDQKVYTRYSGYPGGLRKETLGQLRERKPDEIVRHAVSGMLPKNKLRKKRILRLFIFPEAEHNYGKEITNN